MTIDREKGHKFSCEWTVVCMILYNILLVVDPWDADDIQDENDNGQQNDGNIDQDVNSGKRQRQALFNTVLPFL